MAKSINDRAKELRAQGMRTRDAQAQAAKEARDRQDREWREQGQQESGGSRSGWGLK